MSHRFEDEETWDEERLPRVREPLEIRFSIQPARPRTQQEGRKSAQRLLAELLELPEREQLRRLRESRFQDPLLRDLLLESSHAALPFEAPRAGALAALAVDLGSWLQRRGAPEEAEGLCRALYLLGTARRLVEDTATAEAAFQQAAHLAVSISERGLFCRGLSLLRWDQGRTEEAFALLHQAGQRLAEAQQVQEVAACRALLGLLHLEEGQIPRAASFLAQASEDLSGSQRPWLSASTWLGLALCHADSDGRRKPARPASGPGPSTER